MSNLIIQRGNSFSTNITFWNSTASESFDLTGYTVKFTVKKNMDIDKDDSFALIQKDIIEHVEPLSGSTTLTLSSSETNISADDYVYDFKLVSGSYSINSNSGICEVVNIVTRR